MPAKSKSPDPAALVSEDAIRQRAYFMWEADGRPDGKHEHYWAQAHAEATKAFVEATTSGVARTTRGKSPNTAPAAVKASKATKEKVKAKSSKAAEPKKATRQRAALTVVK